MIIKIDVDTKVLRDKLGRFVKHLNKQFNYSAVEIAKRFKANIRRNITIHNIIYTHTLWESVGMRIKPYGAEVYIAEPYWKYVEYGTSPHWIPATPWTVGWAEDKYLFAPPGRKFHAFRASVHKHGTRPHPFVRPAIDALPAEVREEIRKALERLKKR